MAVNCKSYLENDVLGRLMTFVPNEDVEKVGKIFSEESSAEKSRLVVAGNIISKLETSKNDPNITQCKLAFSELKRKDMDQNIMDRLEKSNLRKNSLLERIAVLSEKKTLGIKNKYLFLVALIFTVGLINLGITTSAAYFLFTAVKFLVTYLINSSMCIALKSIMGLLTWYVAAVGAFAVGWTFAPTVFSCDILVNLKATITHEDQVQLKEKIKNLNQVELAELIISIDQIVDNKYLIDRRDEETTILPDTSNLTEFEETLVKITWSAATSRFEHKR